MSRATTNSRVRIALIAGIAFALIALLGETVGSFARRSIIAATGFMYDIARESSDAWSNHFASVDTAKENTRLKSEIESLRWQLALSQGVAQENQILRELTAHASKVYRGELYATQLAYYFQGIETSSSWLTVPEKLREQIEASGRKLNTPNGPSIIVLGKEGLVGSVVEISGSYGRFLPVSSEDSKFDVLIGDTHGILIGSGQSHGAELTLVSKTHTPTTGTTIFTGGHDSLAPAGIPVGTVEAIESSNEMYNRIEIQLLESSRRFRDGWLVYYDFE